ncbi:MAG: GSCFA domain-containing protein [Bacteroidia bacterium]|nr:GSCFA domain-containing protein [Bacteroidia bacterium]
MKLLTEVNIVKSPVSISLKDKVMVLGSCFADEIGARLLASGFDVCANPFGTLYNPASIAAAVSRLESGAPFASEDCVKMGAGAGLICSFHHHTSFARANAGDFLANANARLAEACDFWRACNKLIVTLGTAFVWRHQPEDAIVANCLKRPGNEFTHNMLSVEETRLQLDRVLACGKEVIFTVSPIRHLGDGAHANTLSKATLQLALASLSDRPRTAYFPAYEILNDELRDYRFHAEDLVHPSPAAVSYIWEKFVEATVPKNEHESLIANEKASRRLLHRNLH